MAKTLTYSPKAKGWPSFYTYYPEKMLSLNNRFYSFKNGELYIHNENPQTLFHEDSEISDNSITGVINEAPHEVKHFKNISLESTNSWSVTLETDLQTGHVNSIDFDKREGEYYSNIYLNDTIADTRGAQGIGYISEITTSPQYKFSFDHQVNPMVSYGDNIIVIDSDGSTNSFGEISLYDTTSVRIANNPNGFIPAVGDFVLFSKPGRIEAYGLKGYYMKYVLTGNFTSPEQLYSIGSNFFKSYA